jgi:hypothetical protein
MLSNIRDALSGEVAKLRLASLGLFRELRKITLRI